MKKIFFILLFVLTYVGVNAQSIWWVDTTATGEEKKVYLGNFETERTSGGLRFARLPVKMDSAYLVTLDSMLADIAASKGYLLLIKQNTDSTFVMDSTRNVKLNTIQTTGDSIRVNIEEANYLLQLIRASIEILDNIVSGTEAQVDVVAALPTGDNNIGNVDIVSLPSGNLGQQAMAASLSTVPANNITDATYIGDIKFGEALPTGSAVIGQVSIDQTTPGTTNKVDIGTNGTVDITSFPAITYGSSTLINANLLDDNPTSVTSSAFLIGDKNKIGFSIDYNETEVGNTVSGTLTLEVSPDSSAWYVFDVILDGAGVDAPNASIAFSADATDYVYLPEFVTAAYIRAIFTGTNTDADDTILITVKIHWQAQ